MSRVVRVTVTAAAAGSFAVYRRWHLTWGATAVEVAAPMTGDEILPVAQFQATRAITIDAPPERVWPWLVQVGFGRAGFYSYDRLDNLGRPSATTLLTAWQHPWPGDVAAPMTRPATVDTAFVFGPIVENEHMVWSKPSSTWAWQLTSRDDHQTRLVTRLRQRYLLTPNLPVTVGLMELADFPMMRKMLRGLKQRAEQSDANGDGTAERAPFSSAVSSAGPRQ